MYPAESHEHTSDLANVAQLQLLFTYELLTWTKTEFFFYIFCVCKTYKKSRILDKRLNIKLLLGNNKYGAIKYILRLHEMSCWNLSVIPCVVNKDEVQKENCFIITD